jgi:hypothetical protein
MSYVRRRDKYRERWKLLSKGEKQKITRNSWTSEEEDRLKELATEYKYDWVTRSKNLPHRDRKDYMQDYM